MEQKTKTKSYLLALKEIKDEEKSFLYQKFDAEVGERVISVIIKMYSRILIDKIHLAIRKSLTDMKIFEEVENISFEKKIHLNEEILKIIENYRKIAQSFSVDYVQDIIDRINQEKSNIQKKYDLPAASAEQLTSIRQYFTKVDVELKKAQTQQERLLIAERLKINYVGSCEAQVQSYIDQIVGVRN